MRRRFLWLLKNSLNRMTIRLAVRGIGPFSVVRHVGRKSGREYSTPLILASVPDGFVAELTYGDTVDWYRNAVAAGGCTVLRGGENHKVISVEPYPTPDGLLAYPPGRRAVLKLLHRREFRLLRTEPARD